MCLSLSRPFFFYQAFFSDKIRPTPQPFFPHPGAAITPHWIGERSSYGEPLPFFLLENFSFFFFSNGFPFLSI